MAKNKQEKQEAPASKSIHLTFKPKKETKGTYVFDEVVNGTDRPIVGTLYVLKTSLPNGQPSSLSVKITPSDE